MHKRVLVAGFLFLLLAVIAYIYQSTMFPSQNKRIPSSTTDEEQMTEGGFLERLNPLSIASLRAGKYEGSDIVIEETLEPGSNYERYLVSYRSDGLKIFALLTVPQGDPPPSGWPAIIFNHGYIPPAEYRTTERYIAYTDGFSRNGYILFRPDYRGHGSSEGRAEGGYGSNAYTIDVLNAFASVQRLASTVPTELGNKPLVDAKRMGMWGHSMGGFITLRSMVVRKDIKAGVIWAGVVASYPDLITQWRRGPSDATRPPTPSGARRWRDMLVEEFGEPSNASPFWKSISANAFLSDISGPVQIHHGTADDSVPVQFSETLKKQLDAVKKPGELYIYEGDDHNISGNFQVAMQRSIDFFDTYLQ